jgi:hypothetical protein
MIIGSQYGKKFFNLKKNYPKNYYSFIDFLFLKIHTCLYSVLPFLALLSINSLILVTAVQSSNIIEPNSTAISTRKRQLGLTITILTFYFIIATIPSGLITGFFYEKLNPNPKQGNLIIFICDSLAFTYHSSKFIVLVLFNSKFKQEYKQMSMEIVDKSKNLKLTLPFTISKSNSDES